MARTKCTITFMIDDVGCPAHAYQQNYDDGDIDLFDIVELADDEVEVKFVADETASDAGAVG